MAFPSGPISGIDVSHYQGVVDWAIVVGGGKRFGFAKASDGAIMRDRYFAANWAGMKTAGLLRGSYHFYRPNVDPAMQTDHFLKCLSDANGGATTLAPGDLPVALDIEVTGGARTATLITGAESWLSAVQAATKRRPIVYTGVNFWQHTLGNPSDLSEYPLWIADQKVTVPFIPGGWSTWHFWQFDKKSIAGVTSPVTDLDAFNGTYEDLRTLAT